MFRVIINELPPGVNHAYYFIRKGKRTIKVKTKECKAWVEKFKAACLNQNPYCKEVYEGQVQLAMTVEVGNGVKARRDIDSFLKITLDALEGLAYKNDNQIVLLSVAKIRTDKNEMIVEVKPCVNGME